MLWRKTHCYCYHTWTYTRLTDSIPYEKLTPEFQIILNFAAAITDDGGSGDVSNGTLTCKSSEPSSSRITTVTTWLPITQFFLHAGVIPTA